VNSPKILAQSILFLPRDGMLARYMLSSCVCQSVCRMGHTPVLYQNG